MTCSNCQGTDLVSNGQQLEQGVATAAHTIDTTADKNLNMAYARHTRNRQHATAIGLRSCGVHLGITVSTIIDFTLQVCNQESY